MNPFRSLALLVFLLAGYTSFGQDIFDQMKAAKRADLLSEIDKGVNFMDMGEYALADEQFRFLLTEMEVIPANLAYYIGKNSYFLKSYKQSIDWLNKYIQLKGTKGQYYVESVKLLSDAEKAYLLENTKPDSTFVSISIDSLLNNNKIDCGASGLMICPVCKGQTVIIEKGKLGDIYRPCPYSDENGFLTCDEYNLLIRGKLKPKF